MAKPKLNCSYKIISKILCLLGCVYQTFKISELYFSYETTTNVRYETEDQFDLPAISICYNKMTQIKDQLIGEFAFNDSESLSSQLDEFNGLSIKEQLDHFEEIPKILDSCYLYNSTQGREIVWERLIKMHFSYHRYCFTLFSQLNGEPDKDYWNRIDQNKDLYYPVRLSMNVIGEFKYNSEIIINIHNRKLELYSSYSLGAIKIDTTNVGQVIIYYSKIIIKNMVETTITNTEVSKQKCIDECKIREFTENTGKYPTFMFFNGQNSKLDWKFAPPREFFDFVFSENCSQFCGQKVGYKEYFAFKEKVLFEKFDKSTYNIFLEFPTHPTTAYEISLKMSFEEYLCLIASILSLWFGFSVLMFTEFCRVLFKRFDKYVTNNQVNRINLNSYKINLLFKPPRPRYCEHLNNKNGVNP